MWGGVVEWKEANYIRKEKKVNEYVNLINIREHTGMLEGVKKKCWDNEKWQLSSPLATTNNKKDYL